MEKVNIKVGDILEITVLNDSIILKRKSHKSLDELFGKEIEEYKFEEISWGNLVEKKYGKLEWYHIIKIRPTSWS